MNTKVIQQYRISTYLLITEFESRTVNYGPSFSPSIYGSSAKRAGHKSKRDKRGAVICSMARENEVSKIFIISLNRTKSKPFKSNGERVHLTGACQRKKNARISLAFEIKVQMLSISVAANKLFFLE